MDTKTDLDQQETLALIRATRQPGATLLRAEHLKMVLSSLRGIKGKIVHFHSAQPWLPYWLVTSYHLLTDDPLPKDLSDGLLEMLTGCQHPEGGFCGGPGQ
jgi:protein farnesyltransferase subunit beta